MFIINIVKKVEILLRTCIKLISLVTLAAIIIIAVIAIVYKPIYKVTFNGQEVGYSENKSKLQNKINEYIKTGDSENVAFVEIEALPKYEICLLKRGIQTNDDEIYEMVKATGTAYYRFYALTENSEEKLYVSTLEQAEAVIDKLKEKKSANKDKLGIIEKYQTELKELSTEEVAIEKLYKEAPKVTYYASTGVASSSKGMNTTAQVIDLGLSLVRPTSGILTSRFGSRWGRLHSGIDIGAPNGTAIVAAAGGTVTYAGYSGNGYGNHFIITHGNGVQTLYAHCTDLYVTAGQTVSQGQLVATVGSTGNSTGNHLHFEVRINGVAQNPQNYVSY